MVLGLAVSALKWGALALGSFIVSDELAGRSELLSISLLGLGFVSTVMTALKVGALLKIGLVALPWMTLGAVASLAVTAGLAAVTFGAIFARADSGYATGVGLSAAAGLSTFLFTTPFTWPVCVAVGIGFAALGITQHYSKASWNDNARQQSFGEEVWYSDDEDVGSRRRLHYLNDSDFGRPVLLSGSANTRRGEASEEGTSVGFDASNWCRVS